MTDKQKYSSFSTKVSYALMEIMFHRMNIGIMKFHYNTVKTCLFENSLFSMMKFLVKCDLEHLTLHRQYPMYTQSGSVTVSELKNYHFFFK